MKRPESPSGEVRRIPFTHPTEVIRPIGEPRHEHPDDDAFLTFLLRVALSTVGVGVFVCVLALMNAAVVPLICGVGLVAAGMSCAALEVLLDDERPTLSERFLLFVHRVVRRRG